MRAARDVQGCLRAKYALPRLLSYPFPWVPSAWHHTCYPLSLARALPAPLVIAAEGTKEDPKAQGELGGLLKGMGYTSENVFKF